MKYPRLSHQENTLAATVYFMEKAELSLDSVTEKIVIDIGSGLWRDMTNR
jgi:hypothetical protein